MDKAIKHKIIDLDNKSKENIDLPSFIFSAEIKEEIAVAETKNLEKDKQVTNEKPLGNGNETNG